MTVLVVGAGGFLGRAVRAELRGRGITVACLDTRAVGGDDAELWTVLDVARAAPAELATLIDAFGIDAIVNCAGLTAGDQTALGDANVRVVLNLVEACLAAERDPRLVQIGSGAEYGAADPGVPLREDAPARPVAPYGITKLVATDIVLTAAEKHGLDGVVLRVFNPTGPGAPPHTLSGIVVAKLRAAIEEGSDEVRLGPLDAYRDFVDVRDVARALVDACVVDDVAGRILNVGSGVASLARTLVDELVAASGFTGRVVEDSDGSPRSGAVSWQAADLSHTEDILGWQPAIDLATSARDLWDGLGTRVLCRDAGPTRG